MIAKPGKLFEAIKEKPFILMPIIIAVIGGLFEGLYSAASTGMSISVIPQMKEFMGIIGPLSVISGVFKGAGALFFNGLIFWILFKIFKGKGSYMQAVSIVGFATYPFVIRDILRYFLADTMDLNAMMAAAKTATFGSSLVAVLSIVGIVFLIWTIALMSKGFSRVFEVKTGKAVLLIVIFFAASILIQTGTEFATLQALLKSPNLGLGG
jgi:hypothetical protein